jgi:erythromycin esterase
MNPAKSQWISRVASSAFFVVALASGCAWHRVAPDTPRLSVAQPILEGDVVGPSGVPIAGALVSLSSHFDLMTSEPAYDVTADAQGHFRFMTLPPGRYGVTVTHAEHAAGYGGIVDISRIAASPLKLRMGHAGIVVEGRVLDEHDKPIANARVQAPALSENEHEVYVAHTNAEGHYVLRLPTEYEFFVVADAPPRPRVHQQIDPKNQIVDLKLGPPPAPRPSDAAITEWLRKSATPIAGDREMDEHGANAFRAIVGDAPIVALGEATHGSAEFPEWRRRIFQTLVEESGFTVYAVETGWAEAFALDDYVVHGRGDLRAAVRALGAWKDETLETMALAQWMREYNADPAHKNKVHFAGFDVLTVNAVPELLAYLRKVDPPWVAPTEKFLAPFASITADLTYSGLPADVQEKTRRDVNALVRRMDDERAAYVARSSEIEWARGRQLARVIQQAEVSFRDYTSRDEFMFENVRWLVQHSPPGTKFVLDAHNAHIAAGGHSLVYMGKRLRETWGKAFVSIGFTFGEGSFFALDWQKRPSNVSGIFSVGRAQRGTFDGDLAMAGFEAFVVDLRQAPEPIAGWLRSPQSMHHIGGRFLGPEQSFEKYVPTRDFDAIIYVDKVSAIHRLGPQ